ncbi:hypothetical protein [Amycolatopsis sp. MtRt-6]|uniref:hypothetical protein n=1 Tax=Amycolatopsis sp. MtRt-6 TaxID=2792782 RepID=UPI001A8C64DA|nr:hypothetical protein [Amycolatopsis sp. MtRt-6]
MLACDTDAAPDKPLGGMRPIQYNVPKLDWEAVQLWGRQLDLRVSETNARMLHSLSENGCAGMVRTYLMTLFENPDWQHESHSLGAP